MKPYVHPNPILAWLVFKVHALLLSHLAYQCESNGRFIIFKISGTSRNTKSLRCSHECLSKHNILNFTTGSKIPWWLLGHCVKHFSNLKNLQLVGSTIKGFSLIFKFLSGKPQTKSKITRKVKVSKSQDPLHHTPLPYP